MTEQYSAHNLTLTDLPHLLRMGDGVVMDSCLRCTTSNATSGKWLSSMMPYTSRHTLVARYEEQRVVGQFYITPDGSGAQVVYLAPLIPANTEDSAWLLMLDAMVREAGRRGAHTLMAELDENSPLFVTLRQSGFAVYARQHLWVYQGQLDRTHPVNVRPATESDLLSIQSLYHRIVPSLLHQVIPPPQPSGFTYRENGRMMAFIGLAEGRDGVYLMPYIDHRIEANAADIMIKAVSILPHLNHRTVTVRVRRHQGWIGGLLAENGFERVAKQAVMVRHIAAGIHSPNFTSLHRSLVTGALPRVTEKLPEVCITTGVLSDTEIMNLDCWTFFGSRERCDGMTHIAPVRHSPFSSFGGVPG